MWVSSLCVFLLCLLPLTAAAPPPVNCTELTQPLQPNELHKVLGTWIFIEGYSNNEVANSVLTNIDSQWMTLRTTAGNGTLLLGQGLRLKDEPCLKFENEVNLVNGTVLKFFTAFSFYKFLQTCSDCLVLHSYNDRDHNQLFYLFGRRQTLPLSELETFRRQAACLHFPEPAMFKYDASKDLCPV